MSGDTLLNTITHVITIIVLVWTCIQGRLPKAKLTELEATLKDTEIVLASAINDNLLNHRDICDFQAKMTEFRSSAGRLREETYIACGHWQTYFRAWLSGLSGRICVLDTQVKDLQVNLCKTKAKAWSMLDQPVAEGRNTWGAQFSRLWHSIAAFFVPPPSTAPADTFATPMLPITDANHLCSSVPASMRVCRESHMSTSPSQSSGPALPDPLRSSSSQGEAHAAPPVAMTGPCALHVPQGLAPPPSSRSTGKRPPPRKLGIDLISASHPPHSRAAH